MEKWPPQENNTNLELTEFLKHYPLPEIYKDKTELAFELKKIISSFIEKDSTENGFKNFNEFGDFARNLRIKYKDAGQHYLYHMLIGSSFGEEKMPTKFDFDGEDSIEKFLKSKKI